MANRNKEKGKKFEERVAKHLARVWGVPQRCITRTLTSGTYAHDYGDIQFRCGIDIPLVVECKRSTSQSLEKLIYKIPPKWVWQLEDELKKAKDKTGRVFAGVIVWSKPYKPLWVITRRDFFPPITEPDFDLDYIALKIPHIVNAEGFYIFPFEEFFREVRPLSL